MSCHKGYFITLEGIDGAGKTLLATELKESLKKQGYHVVHTREPGGTPLAERIRDLLLTRAEPIIPLSALLLFLSSRVEHVEKVIAPALQRGSVVICERFHDSTIAYQGWAEGLGETFVEKICALVCPIQIDKTFLIDLDEKEAQLRRGAREKDHFESQEDLFHQKVRQGYLHLANTYPERITILDGSQKPDLLCSEALNELKSCLFQVG